MADIGYYTLPVILSFKGIDAQVNAELGKALEPAAKKAGEKAGETMATGAKKGAAKAGQTAGKAYDEALAAEIRRGGGAREKAQADALKKGTEKLKKTGRGDGTYYSTELSEGIRAGAPKVTKAIEEPLKKAGKTAAKTAAKPAAKEVAKEYTKSISDDLKGALSGVADDLADGLVTGVADGLKTNIGKSRLGGTELFEGWAEDLVDKAAGAIKDADIVGAIGEGISSGKITDFLTTEISGADLANAGRILVGGLKEAVEGGLGELRTGVQNWTTGIANDIASGDVAGAIGTVKTAIENATDIIGDIGVTLNIDTSGAEDLSGDMISNLDKVENAVTPIISGLGTVTTIMEIAWPGAAKKAALGISAALGGIAIPAALGGLLAGTAGQALLERGEDVAALTGDVGVESVLKGEPPARRRRPGESAKERKEAKPLGPLVGEAAVITPTVDTGPAEQELSSFVDGWSSVDITPPVDPDTAPGETEMGLFQGKWKAETIDPKVDVDTAAAQAKLDAFIGGAQSTTIHIPVTADTSLIGPNLGGGRARGGGIYGSGGPTQDNIPALLSSGEHVLSAKDVAALGGQAGVYSFRKALHRAKGGAVNSEIQAVSDIAAANGLSLTSGFRDPGGPTISGVPASRSYHGSGAAGDFSNGVQTDEMLAFARYMATNYGVNLSELIYDDPRMPQLIHNGKVVDKSFYGASTLRGHRDHVHVAIKAGAAPELVAGNKPLPGGMTGAAGVAAAMAGAHGTTGGAAPGPGGAGAGAADITKQFADRAKSDANTLVNQLTETGIMGIKETLGLGDVFPDPTETPLFKSVMGGAMAFMPLLEGAMKGKLGIQEPGWKPGMPVKALSEGGGEGGPGWTIGGLGGLGISDIQVPAPPGPSEGGAAGAPGAPANIDASTNITYQGNVGMGPEQVNSMNEKAMNKGNAKLGAIDPAHH